MCKKRCAMEAGLLMTGLAGLYFGYTYSSKDKGIASFITACSAIILGSLVLVHLLS